jgi:hypothetical protein
MNAEVFGNKTVAAGAQLRRSPGGFFSDFTTGLFRLEVKYLEEPEPGYVSHRPCKRPIIAIPSIHAFNENGVIVPNQPVGSLKMKVTSLVKYLLMRFRHKKPSFLSAMRALDSTRESLLPHGKLVLGFLKEARIANLDVIRGSKEKLAAHINAHRFASRGQYLIKHIITGEDHKPLASSATLDSENLNIALNRAREPKLESAYMADSEVFALDFPASLLEDERIVSISALESRKSWLITILNPAKESLKGPIEPFNHLLETLRAHVLIFREGIFKAGEFLYLVISRDGFMIVPVGDDALFQGCVVEIAAKVKPSRSILDSLKIRLNAIFKGFLHCPVPRLMYHFQRKESSPIGLRCLYPQL